MNAPDLCPMLRLLLTERQAAAALGVSTDTLRREGKRRRVGYAMIAGRPRYTEQHLAAHIHAQEVKPCNESDNPTVPARSAIAGSPGVQTALCGAGRGSTPRTRQTCRASLGVVDFAAAGIALARWITNNGATSGTRRA